MLLVVFFFFFFFKQKTAYEMRISDWSSDVCSSDLVVEARRVAPEIPVLPTRKACRGVAAALTLLAPVVRLGRGGACPHVIGTLDAMARVIDRVASDRPLRSEEHTSELQSLMRHSYAVFCLKKKKETNTTTTRHSPTTHKRQLKT